MFKDSKFNLIELIIVIAIIGILASIVIPNISDFSIKAKDTRRMADIRNVQTAVDMYYAKNNGEYPTNFKPLFTNEPIVWNELYTDYIKQIPKMEEDEYFYIDPYGTVVVNYNTNASFLKWLKESRMIVSNPTDPVYEGMLPPKGGVFLNYDINAGRFVDYNERPRILTLSVAMTGDCLLEAYKVTKDPIFLERAKMVGDYLSSNIYSVNFWGRNFHYIVAEKRYEGGAWVDRAEESYTKDMAITAKFLIELSRITKDQSYAIEGKKLLDTLIEFQDLIETSPDYSVIAGALPNFGLSTGISWTQFPLDLGYMLHPATELAHSYFKEDKYLVLQEKYFNFIEKSFEEYSAISLYGLPYGYVIYESGIFQGSNFDPVTGQWGRDKPITTDQLFYVIIGLQKANSSRAKEMYNIVSQLANRNYHFWGQYSMSGNPVSSSYIELCNTGFFLEMAKKYDPTIVRNIQENLLKTMNKSNNPDVDASWVWAIGENYVESLVSAVSAKSILYQETLNKYQK